MFLNLKTEAHQVCGDLDSHLTQANIARTRNSHEFALEMAEILKLLFSEGIKDKRDVVSELNRREIKARRGGIWSVTQYKQLWRVLSDMGYVGCGFVQKQREEKQSNSLLDLPEFLD